MNTRVQRRAAATAGPEHRVVTWRDVTSGLDRIVFGEQRPASSYDELCALCMCVQEARTANTFSVLALDGVGWARRLPDVLRAIEALHQRGQSCAGPRAEALHALKHALCTRLAESGARGRGAGDEQRLSAISKLSESELRAVLQATDSLSFVDPFALSPVEMALVERALVLLSGTEVQLPLPDLPLNAARPRDPLEAAVAWAEERFGESVDVCVLPRAWGRERGASSTSGAHETTSLRSWQISSVHEECEWVVRDVLRRAAEGESYDGMAVVCVDPTRRAELVEWLRSAAIPVFCNASPRSAFSSFFANMVSLVRHASSPFPSAVWESLRAALLQGPTSDHRASAEWLGLQRKYAASLAELVRESTAPRILASMSEALTAAIAASSWSELLASVRQCLDLFGTAQEWGLMLARSWRTSDDALSALAREDSVERGRAVQVAHESLTEWERSLKRMDASGFAPSMEVLAVVLEAGERQGTPSSRAAAAGAVRVVSALEEAPLDALVAYLLDMTSEAFPGPAPEPPLGMMEALQPARERRAQHRWSAYAALARLTEHVGSVTALCPHRGENLEEMQPADGLLPEPIEDIAICTDLSAHVQLRAAREWTRRTMVGDAESLGQVAPSARLDRATGEDVPIPITRLERFVACPYQGFVAAALGGREPERKPWMAGARELGSTRHEALHVVFDSVRGLLERPETRPEILFQHAQNAFDGWANALHEGDRGVVDGVDREAVWGMVERALAMALDDPAHVYVEGEVGFGSARDKLPALELPLSAGMLKLQGRVDRIDGVRGAPGVIRVVDYKSGTSKPSVREVGTSMLQAPLYALALTPPERRGGAPNEWAYLYPRAGEVVDSRSQSKVESQAKELTDRIALSVNTATQVIERVRLGLIAPQPKPGACGQCDAADICRYDTTLAAAEETDAP